MSWNDFSAATGALGTGINNTISGLGGGLSSLFSGLFGQGSPKIGASTVDMGGLINTMPTMQGGLPQSSNGIFGDINFDDLLKITMAGLSYGQNQDQLKMYKQAMQMQQAEMDKSRDLQKKQTYLTKLDQERGRENAAGIDGSIIRNPYYSGSAEDRSAAWRLS